MTGYSTSCMCGGHSNIRRPEPVSLPTPVCIITDVVDRGRRRVCYTYSGTATRKQQVPSAMKPIARLSATTFIWAALTCICLSTESAATNTFFSNLAGRWSGAGRAYLPKAGEVSANCDLKITGSATKIDMKGTCGSSVFRRGVGFSLRSAGENKYVGTYTGSRSGPAKLHGTLRGKQLALTITWGGLVNGDRTAKMVLQRTGEHSFVQSVIDEVGGKTRKTSSFRFTRN